jgi:hypothetical protein
MSQQALTIVAEIDPARRDELDELLAAIGEHPHYHALMPLGRLPCTHFFRLAVLDNDPELPEQLVLESNHDGSRDEYYRLMADKIGAGLDRVFACCKGWPAEGVANFDAFRDFLEERALRAEAFHCGYRGHSADRVANDLRVRTLIAEYVDAHRDELVKLEPLEIQRRIRGFLAERKAQGEPIDLSIAGATEWDWWYRLITAILRNFLRLLTGVLFVIAGMPMIKRRNKIDEVTPYGRAVWASSDLVRIEDKVVQNQLTHVVELKPGWFRLTILRLVLLFIDLVSQYRDNRGELGGIPTIHFGRWVIVPDPRPDVYPPRNRLLFFSNYDGSWESYLGDFIDHASEGLTAIWTNTRGFPYTEGLYGRGASDEEAFKQWTRDHQVPTQVWYSNVPNATVQNVIDARYVRERVERPLSEKECERWLARI